MKHAQLLVAVVTALLFLSSLLSCSKSTDSGDEDTTHFPPDAPIILSISEVHDEPNRGLRLSFQDESNDETGFKIERSVDGTTYTHLTNLPANTTSYTDWTVEAYEWYHYRVCAYNDYGSSEWLEKTKRASSYQVTQLPVIDAIADAYVDSTYPTTNFNTSYYLLVTRIKRDDGGSRKAYVKFSLSSIPNYAVDIEYAELRLFTQNEPTGGVTIHLREVLDDWSEGAVTWDTRPDVSFTVIDFNQTIYNNGMPYTWDVTSAVRSWHGGNPNYGIQIESVTNNYQAVIYSRERTSTLRPKLTIEYLW